MTKKEKEKRAVRIDSFMKLLISVIIIHGMLCITTSYVLTFMGYESALESLSSTMASEIVAPVVTYGVTKLFENALKYNDWPGLKKKGEEE